MPIDMTVVMKEEESHITLLRMPVYLYLILEGFTGLRQLSVKDEFTTQ